jgi:hypothetical protein
MRARPALILIVFAQMFAAGSFWAATSEIMGRWKVEITFKNGENRSLGIEALDSGKGSFQLLDPRSTHWVGAKTSEAKWTQGEGNSVTFSGAVEFLIGNVGRDAGTLVLKGKFGTDGAIAGEATFFPLDQDPNDPRARPSKIGTFKAIRVPAG